MPVSNITMGFAFFSLPAMRDCYATQGSIVWAGMQA